MEKLSTVASLRHVCVGRLFLLLLCLAAGRSLWAQTTHELKLNSGATESTDGGAPVDVPKGEQSTTYFQIIDTDDTGGYNYNPKYNGYYEGSQYTAGLKIQAATKIYFTVSGLATVTIVQATKANNDDNTKGIRFGLKGSTTAYASTAATTPAEVTGTTERVRVYTFNNQPAGEYAIERNVGETGLFYVKVVEQKVATWEYTADSKEIDGEVRPYQGTVTFTGDGVVAGGTMIDEVPGITVSFNANTNVINIPHYDNNRYEGLALDGNGNVVFTPSVNGYLSVKGNFYQQTKLGDITFALSHTYYKELTEINVPLIAGTSYTLNATGYKFNLAAFTFRPAFLNPTETAEQTETFEANSATTKYPILVHNADAGVRFSGDRSVVNLSNEGDVTLVGGGTAVIRGKVLSGENELTAYYTLHADVLSVASMTPTDGSTIITLDNSSVYIRFSDKIASTVDDTKVVVLKDATPLTNINVAKAGSSVSLHEKTLVLSNFPAMEAGSTYTIRLMSGCVSKEGASDVKNPEFIGTFTIESTEPPLTWVYPNTTSAVRIGTSIVLQTSAKIDESYPSGGVIGTLTYEGGENAEGYPMTMTAIKDDKKLVFKPKKPMVPNKLYTLTVGANQVKLDGINSMITKNKVFMFTTGTATGDAPVLTSSNPTDGAVINLPSSTTKIDLYFDQNLELEPYSTVNIYPINGSESLSRGTSEKLNDAGVLVPQNMTIDSEDPTHLSFEVGSDLKYDLYYEMVIPANIVTAPGGMPNSASTVKFKINRNPSSHEVVASTFYPHTWDFNKFGNENDNSTTAYNIINNYGGSYTNSLIYDNSNFSYKTRNANNGFDQGNDVYFTNKNNEKDVMDEFKGIRISLNKPNCQRFELAKVTKEVQQGTETQKVVVTNADGTTKWLFRMNGNTHYMTLSNVPKGKLYMVISSPYIGINSPNATFESVSGEGYTLENDNTLLNTNGTKKVVIDVTEAGDVSFCLKNFTCEKIAVAADTKTFKTNFVKDDKTYATDRLSYDVRYDLLNAFTSHNVKAYYVSAITNKEGVNAADITGTQVDPKNAVKADQGILAVYQGAVSADTKVPIFKADVNTAALEVTADGKGSTLTNMLKVIGNDETTFPASAEGYYNYVLAAKGTKTTGVGFYRYTGSTFSPRAAYLPMPIAYVNTGSGSSSTSSKGTRLLLLDADEQVATAILEVKGDGIATRNNDGYYYNLNGMRVDQPKAGIYIRNGKKVVVK